MESTSQQSPCVVYDQSKADDVAGTSIISYAAVADSCIDAEVKTVIMVVDKFIPRIVSEKCTQCGYKIPNH